MDFLYMEMDFKRKQSICGKLSLTVLVKSLLQMLQLVIRILKWGIVNLYHDVL